MDGNTAREQVLSLRPAEISHDAIKIVLTNGKTLTGDNSTSPNLPPPPLEAETNGKKTKLLPQYQSHNNGQYQEYFLLEHRQALEFDRDLGNKTGLVIYHVDESVPRMNNAGYPGQEGWPRNGNHYRVAVLAADTQFHLERGINKGDSRDTWKPGVVLGPGSRGRTSAGKDENDADSSTSSKAGTIVYPNTDTYQYGMVRETGLSIETVSEAMTELTVRISWENFDPLGTAAPTATAVKTALSEPAETTASCTNLWSWVDLPVEDDNGVLSVESLSCDKVASDPDQYCSLSDFSMGWQVWEICREECPNSDCHL